MGLLCIKLASERRSGPLPPAAEAAVGDSRAALVLMPAGGEGWESAGQLG